MRKNKLKSWFLRLLGAGLAVLAVAALLNGIVIFRTAPQIITVQKAAAKGPAEAAMILGAAVYGTWPEQYSSPMLRERLDTGIELYKSGAVKKLLMTGDHGRATYNEVQVMKEYAMAQGVPEKDIFMDHAGFNTYDSVMRAQKIFEVKSMVIVTQQYHLYRALYLADGAGITAWGTAADKVRYKGQTWRDIREFLARTKDFFNAWWKPPVYYGGQVIPITGDGRETDD